jgi:hypothetical protein
MEDISASWIEDRLTLKSRRFAPEDTLRWRNKEKQKLSSCLIYQAREIEDPMNWVATDKINVAEIRHERSSKDEKGNDTDESNDSNGNSVFPISHFEIPNVV